MSLENSGSHDELVEYLDREVASLLHYNCIYDIGSYGWLSEHTEDPEFIGHAMWQLSPPIETDWEYLSGKGPLRHRPTEKEKLLTVAGYDFEGLMKAGRLSIGLSLFHKSIADAKPFDDNHYFWLHHTDAMLQLNMASDRIREYFVVSFFDESSESYKSKGRRNRWYVTPFIQARDLCQKESIGTNIKHVVTLLPDIAERIFTFRELRNSIVHNLASRLAKMHIRIVERQQHDYDKHNSLKTKIDILSFDEIKQQHKIAENKCKAELSESVKMLLDWYKILIKFSSYVFEAVHWLRKANRNV